MERENKSRLTPRFGAFERACIVVPLTRERRYLCMVGVEFCFEHGKFELSIFIVHLGGDVE